MTMLVLSEHDVRQLLDMESCIEAMTDVLTALARGELFNPLRSVVRPPETAGLLGLMPAHRAGPDAAYALKEIVVTPSNPTRGLDAHQGAVLLHDGDTGQLVAILNASPVTEIRTSAVSAVATRALARGDAGRVAILGAGVQARGHVHALRAVLDEPEIRIWSRNLDAAGELAAEVGAVASPSADAALFGAEVVCTTTAATEPVLERRWLAQGAHVNAVGACVPTARELDTQTVVDSSFFVDRRESALNEAGDYVIAAAEGAIGPDHIKAELGEVLAGHAPWTRERGRAHGLRVARDRRRGPRERRAPRPAGARARRRHGGRLLIPLDDIERAASASAPRGSHAARPASPRRRAARDLAQAREPPADRLLQAPRRRKRDPRGAPRGLQAASSRRAPATWRRAWRGWLGELRVPATIVVPDNASPAKLAAVERLGGRIVRISWEKWWAAVEADSERDLGGASRGSSSTPCATRR